MLLLLVCSGSRCSYVVLGMATAGFSTWESLVASYRKSVYENGGEYSYS